MPSRELPSDTVFSAEQQIAGFKFPLPLTYSSKLLAAYLPLRQEFEEWVERTTTPGAARPWLSNEQLAEQFLEMRYFEKWIQFRRELETWNMSQRTIRRRK